MFLHRLLRSYHPMKMPWGFDDKTLYPLYPISADISTSLSELSDGFKQSYKSLISSMANKELDMIENYSTEELYNSIREAFMIIHNRKHDLDAINQESIEEVDIKFFNEKIKIMIPKAYFKYSTMLFANFNKLPNRNLLNHKIEFLEDDELQIIFQVSALITSPYKLIMFDENKNIIRGDSSTSPELHLIEYQARPRIEKQNFIETWNYILEIISVFTKNQVQLEKVDWVISDIDNYLKKSKEINNEF